MIHYANLVGTDHNAIHQNQGADMVQKNVRACANQLNQCAGALVMHHQASALNLNHA